MNQPTTFQPGSPAALLLPGQLNTTMMAAICVMLSAGFATVDMLMPSVNISIGHTLPVILYVLLTRRSVPWSLALLLMTLTLLVYLFKPLPGVGSELIERLRHFRIVNRGMVLTVIALITLMSYRIDYLTSLWHRTLAGLPSTEPGEDFFDQLDRLLVALACVFIMALLMVFDLLSSVYINLPILYAVPLLLCAWTCSRKLLWWLTPLAVAMPLLTYFIEWVRTDHELPRFLLANRLLTAGVGLVAALLLHYWIGWQNHLFRKQHLIK